MREVETSLASLLPLLPEWHRISMTIGLSSSGYSSECRRWKEKEDREGQVEVEEENRLKEMRSCI